MRRLVASILAVTAVLSGALAAVSLAEKPAKVILGNVIVTFDGSVSPKKLPRSELAPIAFNVSGEMDTTDGSHPPALTELVIEADKNGAINAKGVPTCTAGKLQAQDTPNAEKACSDAIVGEGKAAAEVEFPEQAPFLAKSKLLAFNGGVKGGKTTIFVHAYLSAPVSAAIVTVAEVSKIRNGRYGLKTISTIPKIAGGYGSPVSFDLTIKRIFTYKGKQQSYLLAKCPDGHLDAHGVAKFADGRRIAATVSRACVPKG